MNYSIILDEIASFMMHRLVEIMLIYMHYRRELCAFINMRSLSIITRTHKTVKVSESYVWVSWEIFGGA